MIAYDGMLMCGEFLGFARRAFLNLLCMIFHLKSSFMCEVKRMKHDQVFTPDYIVRKMLDDINYRGENLRKTILEP